MAFYVHEATMQGFLTALARGLKSRVPPEGIYADNESPAGSLFDEIIHIGTDSAQAARLSQWIGRSLSDRSWTHVYRAWLSSHPEKGRIALRYLALGLTAGKKIDMMHHHSDVKAMHDVSRKVGTEAHRLLGLLRFRETEDRLLYATMEPDHHILPLVGSHFADRLRGERWLIHDMKRNYGALCDGRRWQLVPLEITGTPVFSEVEPWYQQLWQRFFTAIAIEERSNARVQKNFMPKRYWKHLIEKPRGTG